MRKDFELQKIILQKEEMFVYTIRIKTISNYAVLL